MDPKQSYALHIAAAIRAKKAIAAGPEDKLPELEEGDGLEEIYEEDKPLDSKATRKERIKAILAR